VKATPARNKKKQVPQPESHEVPACVEGVLATPIKESWSGRDELSQVLDDLALQTMVRGAKAFQKEVLIRLVDLGNLLRLPEVTREALAAATLIASDLLTDDDARSIVARMQNPASIPATKQMAEEYDAAGVEQPSMMAFEDDPELLADFVLEADEHLATIEGKILLLERDPSLIDTIHAVFRSFHSIKGLAGFLGLKGVQAVAHEVETLLDHARNLRISVNSDVVDLVLESSEYLKEEVSVVRSKLNSTPIPIVRDNANLLRMLSAAMADIGAGRPVSLCGIVKPPRAVAVPPKPELQITSLPSDSSLNSQSISQTSPALVTVPPIVPSQRVVPVPVKQQATRP
jgi:two-component system, chemotaxis family, sensor kinase CheA